MYGLRDKGHGWMNISRNDSKILYTFHERYYRKTREEKGEEWGNDTSIFNRAAVVSFF